MRICVISEYFHPDNTGGTGTLLSQLARQLQDSDNGLSIEALTGRHPYRGEGRLPAYSNWNGIRIHRVNAPPSNQTGTVQRLLAGLVFTLAIFLRLMRRRRYDVLLIVTNPPTLPLAARLYGRLHHVPYVYLIHDLYPDIATALGVLPREHWLAPKIRDAQHGWLHAAHTVVGLGRCMRDYLVEHYQLPVERIAVIPNWSHPEEIHCLGTDTRFRATHQISGPVVLYAGNFGQYQNFDNILDAAKMLRHSRPELTFVLVGEGTKKAAIMARVTDEKIDNVRVLPFVEHADFEDLLASADISLVTLEPGAEGLGVPSKFYNILASGRPTVAIVAPDSEVARVIQEEECGVQVEQGNPRQLAEVLEALLAAPERRERLGRNARRACEATYTLEKIAEKFERVLKQAKAGA